MNSNKDIDIKNPSLNQTEVPELDVQTANQLLNNVLAACDQKPNTIPVEVLESWGNYKRPRFHIGKTLSYITLVLLVLLPMLFFRPTIVAERTNVESSVNAIYDIKIQTMLPLRAVSATLDGAPITVNKSNSKEYSVELTKNGTLEVKAVSFNGQISTKTYEVSHLDTDKPVFISSYNKGNSLYLVVQDTYTGIDYDAITGLKPLSYDEESGELEFEVPNTTVTLTIPDKAGNELVLLLSPVEK